MRQYFGKYRGKVIDNVDPNHLGRIKVSVPTVLQEGQESWAMPCTPYAGPGIGFYLIPPVAANVWVEFVGGDPDYPVWSGCFWGENELPAGTGNKEAKAEIKILRTEKSTITIDDDEGSITIETESKMKIELKNNVITIVNNNASGGKIEMNGKKVAINDTALEVT